MKKKFNPKKHISTLTFQISSVFVSILVLSFVACWLINQFFLEKYYINNKEKTLTKIYTSICDAAKNEMLTSEAFGQTLQYYSSSTNSSIIIITSLFEPIRIYSNEPSDYLVRELENNILGFNEPISVISKTDEYVLVRQFDRNMSSEYIEMWGNIPGGGFFMLRTALESIRESVNIANRFLLMVAIGSSIISGLLIYFFTNRFSKPILELSDISSKMANMDFDARYTGSATSEILTLGKNINYLSETLEEKISELKQANVELRMDLANKEKINERGKLFISNVSHELKTPIALIQGYAEGLMEGVNEAEERDYYCDVIIDEAKKMNTMVSNLLKLSEIESGNMGLTITRFDIVDLIQNFIQSSEIMTKQNDIMVMVDSNKPIYVWADEFMIEEVFMNYFTNAIHHCESKSQKVIKVSFEEADETVKVSIFNTGKLVPEDSIELLWNKFYKVDKARTREYGGSGVGLSIVKAIMDSHGQKYGVNNEEDGVTFWFTLDTKE